jgi:hypothetical protein
LKRGRLNIGGKTEDGKEFHRKDVAGKKEVPQRTILGLPISTQKLWEVMAPLVFRGRRKGGGMRVYNSLEHLPL